ncbi:VCBS repeat-containing protein [Pontibacter harenae]|uniref:VCBS repeat-containing protein n=1 Tax=Pontibacter harenae TaxID=2894083 RepID=UPI001E3125DE|nr:VCBS repeat-containing protein [Pontibacter harenae]MCC9166991.1 VCBS repeat-containing protein [Pontibacter harenae]
MIKSNKLSIAPILIGILVTVFSSCKNQNETTEKVAAPQEATPPASTLFNLLDAKQTNVSFNNVVTENPYGNILTYQYFYNGGGVAVGDLNNDGLQDIYFSGNMVGNRLYLNKGNMVFEDVTHQAGVGGRANSWKTGVSMADVNGDGLLDMYVCYSGHLPGFARVNQLFINIGADTTGMPKFEEMAQRFGLADSAYSVSSSFFDYDRDGDLDMLLLNHNPALFTNMDDISIAQNLKVTEPNMRVKLFRNDKGTFIDASDKAGFAKSGFTYALSAGVADVNNDGWQDIYVSNDYSAPDHLYINNGNGTFTDKLQQSIGHTSLYSMGNEVVDINNDGLQDIFVLDMLPEDNKRQKLLFSPDNYERFELFKRVGFYNQYMRNMLHVNNGDGTFSEVGQLAGMSNTDWSWAPLFADFDNDGWKDLFISNGFLRDFTNLDFIKYRSSVYQSGRMNVNSLLQLVNKIPSSNVNNYIFKNDGHLSFSNQGANWGLNHASNSNGAAYADLDNDGDLDLVINNINKTAFIYQNQSSKQLDHHYLQLKLEGAGMNTNGIGAKVNLYADGMQQYQEQMPSRGYQSSVSPVLHFGLGKAKVDSLSIVWQSGKQEIIRDIVANQVLALQEKNATVTYKQPKTASPVYSETKSPISFTHQRSTVNDFKRQPLLVNPLSFGGPCLVKADVNGDGLEDVFAGGAAGQAGALYLQQRNGSFVMKAVAVFEEDKKSDDANALFFDANKDGNLDLYVNSGGYGNFMPEDALLQDRLYLNDGKGNFRKSADALPKMLTSTSCASAADVDGDGYFDLFVGGRVIPGRYPETPRSYVLLNNGKGQFTDATAQLAPSLVESGMVTDAVWHDLNGDNTPELVLVGEWMPVTVYQNKNGKLSDVTTSYFTTTYSGWWNKLLIEDFNGDGKADLVVGNQGLNAQMKASDNEPAEMLYKDFDGNGSVDPILSYYIKGASYPAVTRDELLDQISMMRTRFADYATYADAKLHNIFTPQELEGAKRLTANHLKTAYFESTPNGKIVEKQLPIEVQYAPVYALNAIDYNQDGKKDLLLTGNINQARLRFGKYDANYGVVLEGDGKGGFAYVPQHKSGLQLKGDVRSVLNINNTLLFGMNQQAIKAYKIGKR